MQRIKHIPQIVFHGDNDKTVPVRMSRAMVEAGRAADARIEYVEVPGGGHVDIAAPAVPKIFEFFSRQSK
jgi:dipeptidyl aminopeptidase/acylaminoacyl peptidase